MSLTELMLVVGLWAVWMAALLALLLGLGADGRDGRAVPLRRHPRAGGRPAWP